MSELNTDILIVGGGLGAVAAAQAATEAGRAVVLAAPDTWLGGQLTTQAVPPDENRWVETVGATCSYQQLRGRIRDSYRSTRPLSADAAADPALNPGRGSVSRLCAEPRVAALVIEELLSEAVRSGRLVIVRPAVTTAVDATGTTVDAVTFDVAGRDITVSARYVLDATELGDVIDLAGIDHVTGAESRDDTGEPHANAEALPYDQQSFTWCFAIEYRPGEDHTIDRPVTYDLWREFVPRLWTGRLFSWTSVMPPTLEPLIQPLFSGPRSHLSESPAADRWSWRRILSTKTFEPGHLASDVTLVNWAQNGYWEGPLVGVDLEAAQRHREGARELSRSFLYWMQTEAPTLDGGTGHPGLRPHGESMGTIDGLAREPYVRESRRIVAKTRITENDIGVEARELAGLPPRATRYRDSVGIGAYRIDIHPSTGWVDRTGAVREPRTFIDLLSHPFEIPMGSLIPTTEGNLIAAGKTIGTTHVSNGAYRLHPVEWNIGESAGALAAHCIEIGQSPTAVNESSHLTEDFQRRLTSRGVRLCWPDEIARSVL